MQCITELDKNIWLRRRKNVQGLRFRVHLTKLNLEMIKNTTDFYEILKKETSNLGLIWLHELSHFFVTNNF